MKRTATVSVLSALGLLLSSGLALAQGHFEFTPTEGATHTLFISDATIDGAALENGDEIAVFNAGGTIGGVIIVEGGAPHVFDAYADDGQAPGFQDGQAILFRIYDADAETELDANSMPLTINFEANGFSNVILVAQHNPVPAIHFSDRDGNDFGEVAIGSSSAWFTTITNLGFADLTLESVTVGAGFTHNFGENQVVLAPLDQVAIEVTFSPAEAVEYSVDLTFNSDDPDDDPVVMQLMGVGVAAGAPDISLSDDALAFGEVVIGASGQLTFTISNLGSADLHIESIEDDHAYAALFTTDFDNEAGATLSPNASLDVTVNFTPDEAGEFAAALTIVSDSPGEEEVNVSLTGTGVQGTHFTFTESFRTHTLLVTEALLDGTSLGIGDEIGVFTPNDLCAGGIVLEADQPPVGLNAYGDDPESGEVEGFTAGQAFAFRVWDNSAEQEYPAVALYDDGPQAWQLNGFTQIRLNAQTEAAPEIEIAEGDLMHDFGEVAVGGASNWSFTIRNIGGATLMIHSITSSDEAFAVDFGEHVEIAPNEQVVVPVTFSPAEARDYAGTLTVSSDDGNESEIVIDLTGAGTEVIEPEIVVEPLDIDFG
ncbi:MAG: choice-of-anchor D domain-containing protein, partial [Calditrichaeota bacterium]|nr:choice-of-anchor D domain-containing protein [Calditrichota bacterium]